MKPRTLFFSVCFFIVLIAGGFWYFGSDSLLELKTNISEKIGEVSKNISTPGPLFGGRDASNAILTEAGIFTHTNIARTTESEYNSLVRDAKLDEIARLRVEDMFAKQYFEHVSPVGESASSVAEDAGYEYISIGENIALGNFEDDAALVLAWMNSPGHRANIVSGQYTQLGVAAKKDMYDGDEIWIAAQIFARPLSDCPEPSAAIKFNIESNQSSIENLKEQADDIKDDMNKYRGEQYNKKVEEYNTLVKQINDTIAATKALISQYNKQVADFNVCIQ